MLRTSNIKVPYIAKVAAVTCGYPSRVYILAIRFCRIWVLFKEMVVEKDSRSTGQVQKMVLQEETHISRFRGFVYFDFTDLLYDAFGNGPSSTTCTFRDL